MSCTVTLAKFSKHEGGALDKIFGAIHWAIPKIFLITLVVLVVFYLRWFQLTPFAFLDNPEFGYIVGFILLLIYGLFVKAWLASKNIFWKSLFFVVSILLLGINSLYLEIHIPRLSTTAKCNGTRYYISDYAPLGDEQYLFAQISGWKGIFYESTFGIYMSVGSYKIVCDEEKKETHFVEKFSRLLVYTDSENPRAYVQYVRARLRDHLYFLSEEISGLEAGCDEGMQGCLVLTYTLYECQLDYTACNPLPIRYTTNNSANTFELETDPKANEIILLEQYLDSYDETLIFVYGKNPRCYVDGCEVLVSDRP